MIVVALAGPAAVNTLRLTIEQKGNIELAAVGVFWTTLLVALEGGPQKGIAHPLAQPTGRFCLPMAEKQPVWFYATRGAKTRRTKSQTFSPTLPALQYGREERAPLFRSTTGETRRLNAQAMTRQDVGNMIKRRCRDAGLPDVFSPHSFRATGITLYMSNGGSLNEAQKLAGHADPRTTKLYDRSSDSVSLDEIERIRF